MTVTSISTRIDGSNISDDSKLFDDSKLLDGFEISDGPYETNRFDETSFPHGFEMNTVVRTVIVSLAFARATSHITMLRT